jgi:uncharacterized protein (TIGR01777 family)
MPPRAGMPRIKRPEHWGPVILGAMVKLHVVIAGGTGFLGGALAGALRGSGHRVTVLSRRPTQPGEAAWPHDGAAGAESPIDGADAVVNLAGASIASGRWTAARKADIRNSRVTTTRQLVRAIAAAESKPAVFLSGSAIGYYGSRGDEVLTEDAPSGTDFLAGVCRDWEREAGAAAAHSRVVLLRTGLALGRDGGALPTLALPFRLFAGGRAGTGTQYMSWIHRDDWVSLVQWAMLTPGVAGPINLTAPEPVTNATFAARLGAALHRPAWIPAPAVAMRLVLGEMADALILGGQRVVPRAAIDRGFQFAYPALDAALRALYT